jgi:hypothetical protein
MLADLIDYRRGEAKLMSRPETAVSDVKLTGKEARAILRLRLGKTPESTRVAGIIEELQAKLDAGARQRLFAAPATTSELTGVGELLTDAEIQALTLAEEPEDMQVDGPTEGAESMDTDPEEEEEEEHEEEEGDSEEREEVLEDEEEEEEGEDD